MIFYRETGSAREEKYQKQKGNSDRAETNSVRHIRFSIETDRVREIAHEEQTENGKGDGDSTGGEETE